MTTTRSNPVIRLISVQAATVIEPRAVPEGAESGELSVSDVLSSFASAGLSALRALLFSPPRRPTAVSEVGPPRKECADLPSFMRQTVARLRGRDPTTGRVQGEQPVTDRSRRLDAIPPGTTNERGTSSSSHMNV